MYLWVDVSFTTRSCFFFLCCCCFSFAVLEMKMYVTRRGTSDCMMFMFTWYFPLISSSSSLALKKKKHQLHFLDACQMQGIILKISNCEEFWYFLIVAKIFTSDFYEFVEIQQSINFITCIDWFLYYWLP